VLSPLSKATPLLENGSGCRPDHEREAGMQSHGALVGWSHQDLGERILLRLESFQSAADVEGHEPDVMRVLMTKNQAGVLGQYLVQASGQTMPRKPGFFARHFRGS
jgi:hypothetical protein